MRLIDADALKTKILDYYSYSWQLREEIGDFFDNAPTIIEFDGEITKVVVKGEEYCKRTHWIPCSERLPEEDVEVFVYLFERQVPYIAWVEDCRWYTEDFEVEKENYPTAWMPLPEPWKGEEE